MSDLMKNVTYRIRYLVHECVDVVCIGVTPGGEMKTRFEVSTLRIMTITGHLLPATYRLIDFLQIF